MELDEDPAIEPDPLADWRTPYLDYLLCEALLMDKMEARWLAHHAKSFVLIDGELYKRSHTRILQHCIPIEQGRQLLKDNHGRSMDIMPHLEPWSKTHSDKASTDRP